MPLSLANRITLLRLFCVPFFVLLVIYYDKTVQAGSRNDLLRISATLIFIGTFLSDALDGYIARSRNQVSRLGMILDPMADKALLLSGIVLLSSYSSLTSYARQLPIWFVWLVICRDLMLVTGAILIHMIVGTVTVRPRLSGKVTTFLQMSIIIFVLLEVPGNLFMWIVWSAATFTALSGIQYFLDGIRQFDKG